MPICYNENVTNVAFTFFIELTVSGETIYILY